MPPSKHMIETRIATVLLDILLNVGDGRRSGHHGGRRNVCNFDDWPGVGLSSPLTGHPSRDAVFRFFRLDRFAQTGRDRYRPACKIMNENCEPGGGRAEPGGVRPRPTFSAGAPSAICCSRIAPTWSCVIANREGRSASAQSFFAPRLSSAQVKPSSPWSSFPLLGRNPTVSCCGFQWLDFRLRIQRLAPSAQFLSQHVLLLTTERLVLTFGLTMRRTVNRA